MAKVVDVKNLFKSFTFPVKSAHKNFIQNLFTPDKRTVQAVDGISFSVEEAETVAFIGPNGAGKSTTIKMLTGILYPTSGKISVLGFNPQEERKQLAYNIGTVFGQRSQLLYNLPLTDSFELLSKIYELEPKKYQKQKNNLIELFNLSEIIDQPVRKLSLGQRMRGEIAASLLHQPLIIFLDEPTIGLDVIAKQKLRENLTNINRELKTTIFLTSHDAGDIESICERTIVINHGTIIYDQETLNLKKIYLNKKIITIELEKIIDKKIPPHQGVEIIKQKDNMIEIIVDTTQTTLERVLKNVISELHIVDINIEDPPLEETIRKMYETQKAR